MKVSGEEIIKRSAVLRGERKFDEAIKLIEDNIHAIDSNIHINAWLEAFKAAKEKGDSKLSRKFAKAVAQEDPEVPSIQDYL